MKAVFIKKININHSDGYSFFFKPDRAIKHIAGQFTELSIKGVGKHWFTISSSPGEEYFSITTRLTGSPYKNALDNLKKGDVIEAAEAMGDFVLPVNKNKEILMIAGGIGITPFQSIIKDCYLKHEKRNLHLVYASSKKEDFIDLTKYKSILKSYKKIIGQLTLEDILKSSSQLNDPYIYLSGPEKMIEVLTEKLKNSGIKDNHIIADYFPGYSQI